MAKVYKDLREFLKTLEEEGQLIRVKDEVDPEPVSYTHLTLPTKA